jgi:hypothetical protein
MGMVGWVLKREWTRVAESRDRWRGDPLRGKQDFELNAHCFGMEEGAERAEFFEARGSRRLAIEQKQQAFDCADKEMMLVGVGGRLEAAGAQILGECGEIDMRRDVFPADGLERIIIALMRGVAG